MIKVFFLILAIITALSCPSQSIHDVNNRLGRGVNYGNMFEAPSENEWGNPWQPDYPAIIASLGFSHVRMPIRWEPQDRSSPEAPYTITEDFLARIKEVVDATLAEKLMVVINMHHHEDLYDDPDGEKARFLAMWEQIGNYFKDYPDSLVFEILNEPHGNLGPELWNSFVDEALQVIRTENPTRPVLIGTAAYNSVGALPQLDVPDDENIILTIHYYNPFQFTHQGAEWVGPQADDWLGTEWLDTDVERAVVESEFAPLIDWSHQHDIPIHIGEFGAYSTADIESRERWTTYLARYFESLDWSWAYWEFSAGFGIYDPGTETFSTDLVDALLVNEMPEPIVYVRTPVYESDFSENTDGWFLNVNTVDGAQASLAQTDGTLSVQVDALGSQSWHIQLIHPNIALEKDKKYALSFTGRADGDKPVDLYAGMSQDPWTAYGTTSATITTENKTFSGTIDMLEDDSAARLVFNLGASLSDITITGVTLEELSLPEEPSNPVTGLQNALELPPYPNPTRGQLKVHNNGSFQTARVIDLRGREIMRIPLVIGWNALDLQNSAQGVYFLELKGDQHTIFKIIRE